MTAHTCTEWNPGCYRCDLGRHEVEMSIRETREEAQILWVEYRNRRSLKRGLNPRRAARQMRRRDFIAGYLWSQGIEEIE